MPNGVRSSLIAFTLLTGFALPAMAEQTTTWTDPPARAPAAPKVTPEAAPRATASPEVATPAAVSTPRRTAAARVKRPAPHRTAARHHVRVAHRPPHRAIAAAHTRSRTAALAPGQPVVVRRYAYPAYSYAGFPPSYEDERLDHLRTAVGSGYLVMHRRAVEYPDGRMIRYYRPADDDAD